MDTTRILIVDDEESIRYTFEIFLRREGYGHVVTASSLAQARAAIAEETFDLIISDIVLEGASGTDFLREIRAMGRRCPVVMVTGFPNIKTAAESIRHGAFDYIAKPVNKETLLRFVRQALSHWRLEQEKEALEQENHRYKRYLEVIFSSVNDAIITTDQALNIVQLNDTARSWLALGPDQTISRLADLKGEMGLICLRDAEKVISAGIPVREHQIECETAKGEKRIISLNAVPLRDEQQEFSGAVIVARDISPGLADPHKPRSSFHRFIGGSPIMQGIYRLIENVGQVDTAVLITGESGTGKELAAEALHAESSRREMPLVKVDCASVPEDLLESELFGHARGAFTGADRDRPGRILLADHGTLFLDEIGDISPRMQLRLLRFLQEKTFTPVGRDSPIHVDVRIIAATNVNFKDKVSKGLFREDLYYRLKVVEILLPPLRERRECIPQLVQHFLLFYADALRRKITTVSDQAMLALSQYSWPGNIRELRHIIERACVLCPGSTLLLEHLPGEITQRLTDPDQVVAARSGPYPPLAEIDSEKDTLFAVLARVSGNRTKAAKLLGIDRSTLYRKMKRYAESE